MNHVPALRRILGPAVPVRVSAVTVSHLVERGLPATALARLERVLEMNPDESARLAGVSPATRKRWHGRRGARLGLAASDRVMRAAEIAAFAFELFGNEKNAVDWLRGEIPVLDGERPLDLLMTDHGAREVRDTLMRIAHGIAA